MRGTTGSIEEVKLLSRNTLFSTLEPVGPTSSAAPMSLAPGDRSARLQLARELALDLEGKRRLVTLGGGFVWIPLCGLAALLLSAGLGVRGVWLVFCGLAGVAIGPALTTSSIALLSVVGVPLVRGRFRRAARQLGLSADEAEQAWQEASGQLDERARARLGSRGKQSRTCANHEEGADG